MVGTWYLPFDVEHPCGFAIVALLLFPMFRLCRQVFLSASVYVVFLACFAGKTSIIAPVAQWIERRSTEPEVAGSSPAGRTKTRQRFGPSGGYAFPLRFESHPLACLS
jgi:uncharacterized membrane protein